VFYVYGQNRYNVDLKYKSIHAEVDACNRLKKAKRNTKVDVLVFRRTLTGETLMNAKPCSNCISYIKRNLTRKNYRLSKINI